jgi:hypothetical protein
MSVWIDPAFQIGLGVGCLVSYVTLIMLHMCVGHRGVIYQFLSIILELRILVSLPVSNLPYVVQVKNYSLMGRLHLTKSETRFNTDKTIIYFFVVSPVETIVII